VDHGPHSIGGLDGEGREMAGWALTCLKSVRVAPASVSERGHSMTFVFDAPLGQAPARRNGALLAAGVMLLLSGRR
jgi:hypothetical protein